MGGGGVVAADVESVVLLLSNTVFSSASALLLAVSKESSSVSISSPCKPFVLRNSTLRVPVMHCGSIRHRGSAAPARASSAPAVLALSSVRRRLIWSDSVSCRGFSRPAARLGMDVSCRSHHLHLPLCILKGLSVSRLVQWWYRDHTNASRLSRKVVQVKPKWSWPRLVLGSITNRAEVCVRPIKFELYVHKGSLINQSTLA